MWKEYRAWIEGWAAAVELGEGLCEEACRAFVKTFPEARLVFGQVTSPPEGGEVSWHAGHWWCEIPQETGPDLFVDRLCPKNRT